MYVGKLFASILLIGSGFFAGSLFETHVYEKRIQSVIANIPSDSYHYIWSDAFIHETPVEEKPVTWFRYNWDGLERSWQEEISNFNHDTYPGDMPEWIIKSHYEHWLQQFIIQVKDKNLPDKDKKLQVLQLRLKSLQALADYFANDYDPASYKEYAKYDSEFRDIIEKDPNIIN